MSSAQYKFVWQAPEKEEETCNVEIEADSVSKTILKMKEMFMNNINTYMDEQNLNKEEVALFEEIVSDDEDTVGSKRDRKTVNWRKFQKRKTTYGKKSR